MINFNYTSTCEKVYHIPKERIQYIHGQLSNEVLETTSNIVLGMPDIDQEDLSTVYFKKFFQRIQYKTGIQYKEWFEGKDSDNIDVIFYGHSMDKNDGDIIRFILTHERTNKTNIYYVNQSDYEAKIINLIAILGKDVFEELYYSGKVLFNSIDEMYQ